MRCVIYGISSGGVWGEVYKKRDTELFLVDNIFCVVLFISHRTERVSRMFYMRSDNMEPISFEASKGILPFALLKLLRCSSLWRWKDWSVASMK